MGAGDSPDLASFESRAMMCSRRCMVWWRRNWRWFTVGSLAWGTLFLIGTATLYPVAVTLWPSGPPVNVLHMAFERDQIINGRWTTLRLVTHKNRQCYATPNLVFIDNDDRETQFLFSDWPQLPHGEHPVRIRTRVPPTASLDPGPYRYQARISYTCPNGGYNVNSPIEKVEVAAAPGSP